MVVPQCIFLAPFFSSNADVVYICLHENNPLADTRLSCIFGLPVSLNICNVQAITAGSKTVWNWYIFVTKTVLRTTKLKIKNKDLHLHTKVWGKRTKDGGLKVSNNEHRTEDWLKIIPRDQGCNALMKIIIHGRWWCMTIKQSAISIAYHRWIDIQAPAV